MMVDMAELFPWYLGHLWPNYSGYSEILINLPRYSSWMMVDWWVWWFLGLIGHTPISSGDWHMHAYAVVYLIHEWGIPNRRSFWQCWYSNAINHPPVIIIFMGGMFTMKNGWFMALLYPQLSSAHLSKFCWAVLGQSKMDDQLRQL